MTRIKDGDVLRVFGEEWKIDRAVIGGAPEFLDRRVRDKIKRRFMAAAREIMRTLPAELRPRKVAVKDTRSRWGSCSASGAVSLSWRLAFAPPEVMRYVVIHECCHLTEMNHSFRFWALVGRNYGAGYKSANRWLAKEGRKLFAY